MAERLLQGVLDGKRGLGGCAEPIERGDCVWYHPRNTDGRDGDFRRADGKRNLGGALVVSGEKENGYVLR